MREIDELRAENAQLHAKNKEYRKLLAFKELAPQEPTRRGFLRILFPWAFKE